MVSGYDHYTFMFDTARIGYENTYDMREKNMLKYEFSGKAFLNANLCYIQSPPQTESLYRAWWRP